MESGDKDRLDQWLDGALRQMETAAPRPGLEGRVLARIAVESRRRRTLKSVAWILATASAAAVLALIGLGIGHHSGKVPNPAPMSGNAVMAGVAPQSELASLTPVVRNRSHRKRSLRLTRTIAEPKLEYFPSRRPPSEQELLLMRYAERFPAEAALIAREQGKFEQEIAKAQEEAENDSSRSNQ